MAINLDKPAKGPFDGAGVTIKYYSIPKQFDDCKYYFIQCGNPKSPRHNRLCNARCRYYKKESGTIQQKPVHDEAKDNLSFKNKDHTLCKYYERGTGKCQNAYAGLYFPICEEPCRLWEKSKKGESVSESAVKTVKKDSSQPKAMYRTEISHNYVNVGGKQQKKSKKVFGKKRKRIDLIATLDKPKTRKSKSTSKRKVAEPIQKNAPNQWYTSCKYYTLEAGECHYKVKCRDNCLFFKEKQ